MHTMLLHFYSMSHRLHTRKSVAGQRRSREKMCPEI